MLDGTQKVESGEAPAANRADDAAMFRAAVESAPYAILMVEGDGTIAWLNGEVERLFGWTRAELVGQPVERLVPDRLRHPHAQLRRAFEREPALRPMGAGRDLHGRRKDGSEFPVEVGLKPVATPRGRGVLAAITDITLRRRAEEDLRHLNKALASANRALRQATAEISRKSEEVESFVYIVSHDLRAPLVNLQGFAKELELGCATLEQAVAGLDVPPPTRAHLHAILGEDILDPLRFIGASVAKFDRLITALLTLSRTGTQAYRHDRLDMAAVVAATLDALRRSTEAVGATIAVDPLPEAFGDPTAVGQIVANLVENAVKYADPDRPPRIEIGGRSEPPDAHFWVRDNGVGIPEQAIPRLFQVFQRFHPERAAGDGIGLAAVKRIVARLGGRVWAEALDPVGTAFHFTLPCDPAKAQTE
ncbi:MAG: PAS domain S-box protein [Rhodospirillales bacterium]|nr:PAS domain S-box protein [Rhodospirillales bacterium]